MSVFLPSKSGLKPNSLRVDEADDWAAPVASFSGDVYDSNCRIAFDNLVAAKNVYVAVLYPESTKDYTTVMKTKLKTGIDSFWDLYDQVVLAGKRKDADIKAAAQRAVKKLKLYESALSKKAKCIQADTLKNMLSAFASEKADFEKCGAGDFYTDMEAALTVYQTYLGYREAAEKKKVAVKPFQEKLVAAMSTLFDCVTLSQKLYCTTDNAADTALAKTINATYAKYGAIQKSRGTRNSKK